MKLIIGLGNPEKKYNNTRHNVGFKIIDNYVESNCFKEKFNGLYCEKIINSEKTIFLKPLTYMNNSGISIIKFVNYYNININDILVIQDDIDLPIGTIRFKKNSSSGGHNGIKSIITNLKTKDFARLKIGVANDYKKDAIDFVLGDFSKNENEIINGKMDKIKKVIDDFINNGYDIAKNNLYKD